MSVEFIFVLSIIGVIVLSGLTTYMFAKNEENDTPENIGFCVSGIVGTIVSGLIFLGSGIELLMR